MKKWIALFLSIVMIMLLGACGSSEESTAADSTAAQTTQAEAGEDKTTQADESTPADTSAESTAEGETGETQTMPVSADIAEMIDQADLLAAQYDYDAAVELLQGIEGYENEEAVTTAIARYQQSKASCVVVNPETVPHVFFHSLIVDSSRAFSTSLWDEVTVQGYNAWMVTVDEFNKIIQQLYDNGYVYVHLSDLYIKTTGEDGSVSYAPNNQILLPPGKKAIVLSFDDTSYYAQYMGHGLAEKIVLDENGDLKCEYIDASGNTMVGDYDYLPIIDAFIKEHPDASYRGAKGTIALTGYDGVFGYRTDVDFFAEPTYNEQLWIDAHPECKLEDEIEKAKVIAQAILDDGWQIASHSWGHRPMGTGDLEWLKTDTGKWLERVAPIVGSTDILIYPHGSDIGGMEDYSSANEKYAYLSSVGFHVFCDVNASSLYWNQFRTEYIRQSRIDIDGYTLYTALNNSNTVISQLGLDAASIFDSARPTPVLADGAE